MLAEMNNYDSPVSEVIEIFCEGAVLTGSQDIDLGFTFEDDELLEGDEIIIGG